MTQNGKFFLSIPFSLFKISSRKERDQMQYNLLEYQLLTADILDSNRSLCFSQIAAGSKLTSYKDSHAGGEHHANFFLVAVNLSMY